MCPVHSFPCALVLGNHDGGREEAFSLSAPNEVLDYVLSRKRRDQCSLLPKNLLESFAKPIT